MESISSKHKSYDQDMLMRDDSLFDDILGSMTSRNSQRSTA